MLNPFDAPGSSMASLTTAINLIPNRYGRVEALNLSPAKPVRTRRVVIEEYTGRLNLPTRPPGRRVRSASASIGGCVPSSSGTPRTIAFISVSWMEEIHSSNLPLADEDNVAPLSYHLQQ